MLRFVTVAICLAFMAPLQAQEPTVSVNGVVRDSTGRPVERAEVAIVALQRRVFTDALGAFRIDSVTTRELQLRVRRLGFAPRTLDLTIDGKATPVTVTLQGAAQTLAPVIARASRGGLSGIVVDANERPVRGVEVRVVSQGRVMKTGADGGFFAAMDPGAYVLTLDKRGYERRFVSVDVPRDSGRHLVVALRTEMHPRSTREAANLLDFSKRVALRSQIRSRVLTTEDMERAGLQWINQAVAKSVGEASMGPSYAPDKDCTAILNGGPDTVNLAGLTIEDVAALEVYVGAQHPGYTPPGGPASPLVHGVSHSSVPRLPLDNAERAIWANRTKKCPLVYVWLR